MADVKPIPDGYTAITPYLIVDNAAAYLQFLASAFGAVERVRMPMPEGGIGHAEVEIGGATLMLSDSAPGFPATQSLIHLYVDDVDAVYSNAIASGATSLAEPSDEFYGDRLARITDPFGTQWSISTHIEDVTQEDIAKRIADMAAE